MAHYDIHQQPLVEITEQTVTPDALLRLGIMYCNGRDVPLDMIEAHKWFNLAAVRGSAEAREYRQEIAREMSKDAIGMAQRRAREWLLRH